METIDTLFSMDGALLCREERAFLLEYHTGFGSVNVIHAIAVSRRVTLR